MGLGERFAALTQHPRSVPTRRQHRIPLGLELVSRGCISSATLKVALQQQKKTPDVRIGQILLDMHAVGEEQITSALAAQWSVPVFRLEPGHIPEAAQFLPIALMERYKMLPVHFVKQTNKLHLAFAQVVDHSILYSIQQMLGITTEACIADESALLRAIGRAAHQERPAEYVLNSLSRTELVSMIAGYALKLRTERISAASCNEQIWIRAVSRNSLPTHFLTSITPLQTAVLGPDEY
jgi:hypothetical protein